MSILNQLELDRVEKQLLNVNCGFLKSRYLFIRKLGIDGIYRLIANAHFKRLKF